MIGRKEGFFLGIAQLFRFKIMNKQDNGNTQLNSLRNDFNDRIKDRLYMSQGKRIVWNDRRRFRTI